MKRAPKKGDRVRLMPGAVPQGRDPEHVYTVDRNRRGAPAPYYLDDGDADNPYALGPFKRDELIVVSS